jgi:hypothetical protein
MGAMRTIYDAQLNRRTIQEQVEANKREQEKKKREQWYTDTGNRPTSMQQQLDSLASLRNRPQQSMPRGAGATTIGQQVGADGLRISSPTGMSPSSRRRMHRAG